MGYKYPYSTALISNETWIKRLEEKTPVWDQEFRVTLNGYELQMIAMWLDEAAYGQTIEKLVNTMSPIDAVVPLPPPPR